jgi:hypothetical protein
MKKTSIGSEKSMKQEPIVKKNLCIYFMHKWKEGADIYAQN